MPTRFYLNAAAAGYTPATKRGTWTTSSATLAQALGPRPAGATTTAGVAVGSTTANRDILVGRWISGAAVAAGTISGTLSWVIGVLESNANLNAFFKLHVFVTVGDSDTVRGTLLSNNVGATEWPTTYTGRTEGAKTVTNVAISAGDRIVVEVGYRASSSNTTYTGTVRYGGTSTTDLQSGGTSTADPPWVELSGAEGLFARPVSTIAGDFTTDVPDEFSTGLYGATVPYVSGGRLNMDVSGTDDYVGALTATDAQMDAAGFYVELVAPPSATGAASTAFLNAAVIDSIAAAGRYIGVLVDAVTGQINFYNNDSYFDASQVSLTYSPTDHRWVRVRLSGGSLLWDTSPDAATWTNRRTLATPPSWLSYQNLAVLLEAYKDGATAGTAQFDNLNSIPPAGSAAAETVTVGDAVTRSATTLPRAVAETVTTGDAPARTAMAGARAAAETVTAGDITSRTSARSRAASETVAAGDTAGRVVALPRAAAETVTASDTVTRGGLAAAVPVAATVTAGDITARTVAAARGAAETVTVGCTVARTAMGTARPVTETVTAGNTVSLGPLTQPRQVGEAVSVADVVSAQGMNRLWHSFETGQADDTAVSSGNSGVGGVAFSSVTVGTAAALIYDTSALRGTLSMRYTTAGTAAQAFATWSGAAWGTPSGRVYGRATIAVGAAPAQTSVVRVRSSAAQVFRITVNGSGIIELRNAANTAVASTSVALTFGVSVWRIAWDVAVGASAAGTVHVFWDPASTVPDETLSAAGANFGTGLADEVSVGCVANVAGVDIRVDDVLVTGQGLPGPAAQSRSVSESLSAGDGVARGGTGRARAAAEAVAAGDSVSRLVGRSRAAAEAVAAADAVSRMVARARAASEALAAGDSVSRLVGRSRAAAEAVAAGDGAGRAGMGRSRAIAEAAAAACVVARGAAGRSRSVAESVAVAYASGTGTVAERLFAGLTPALADMADGTPSITTATTFRALVDGQVPAVEFRATETVSGTYAVAVWTVDSDDPGGGTLLQAKTLPGLPEPGVDNVVLLDTPVPVTAGTLLRVGVFNSDGRYVATTGFFGSDWTVGNLVADADDDTIDEITITQGTYRLDTVLDYPNANGDGTCYHVGPVFYAGSGGRQTAEAVTVADVVGCGPVARSRAVGELVAATDGLSRLVAVARPVGETVTAANGVGVLAGLSRQVAEAATAVDMPARLVGRSRAAAAAVAAGDGAGRVSGLVRAVAEVVAVADVAGRGPLSGARAVAEMVAAAEVVTRAGSGLVSVVEAVTVAAAVGRGVAGLAPRAVAETVAVVDGLSRLVARPRGVAEAVSVAGVPVRGVLSQPGRQTVEAVQLADVVVRGSGSAVAAGAAVQVAATAVRGVFGRARQPGEVLAVADGAGRAGFGRPRLAVEAVQLADGLSRVSAGTAGVSAVLAVADVVDRLAGRARLVAESVTAAGLADAGVGLVRSVAETVIVVDSPGRGPFGRVRLVTVAVQVDAVAGTPPRLRPVGDRVRVVDTRGGLRFPAGPQVRIRRL